MKKSKGQSSIIDAFFFLMICASAATLMIYTAGLYGVNTSRQMAMVYNFEYANNALIALHYSQDSSGNYFLNKLEEKLGNIGSERNDVQSYFENDAEDIWKELISSSPSSSIVLRFYYIVHQFHPLTSVVLLLVHSPSCS